MSTMARMIAGGSAAVLTILLVYLPSAYQPSHFIEQIIREHEINAAFWGETHAIGILNQMFALHTETAAVASPVASASRPQFANDVNAAVANEMAQVSSRLFANEYFKGIDALSLLATYRLSTLLEWLPLVGVFVFVACFDGLMMRLVRSKEFAKHSPVMFGLFSCGVMLVIAFTIISFLLPTAVHPMVIASAPVAIGFFGSVALANFHRHG